MPTVRKSTRTITLPCAVHPCGKHLVIRYSARHGPDKEAVALAGWSNPRMGYYLCLIHTAEAQKKEERQE
jgi:hypothetical protein